MSAPLTDYDGITPGPWESHGRYPDRARVVGAVDRRQGYHRETLVATINGGAPEYEANRRAITALPDLLARLRRAEALLTRYQDSHTTYHVGDQYVPCRCAVCHDALTYFSDQEATDADH